MFIIIDLLLIPSKATGPRRTAEAVISVCGPKVVLKIAKTNAIIAIAATTTPEGTAIAVFVISYLASTVGLCWEPVTPPIIKLAFGEEGVIRFHVGVSIPCIMPSTLMFGLHKSDPVTSRASLK